MGFAIIIDISMVSWSDIGKVGFRYVTSISLERVTMLSVTLNKNIEHYCLSYNIVMKSSVLLLIWLHFFIFLITLIYCFELKFDTFN